MKYISLALGALFTFVQAATAQNLLVNGGFESHSAAAFGNNNYADVSPWNVGRFTSNQSVLVKEHNVIRVDGAGGFNFLNAGPDADATGPGAGVPQQYLDALGLDLATVGTKYLFAGWQYFTAPCDGTAVISASFANRSGLPGQVGEVSLSASSGPEVDITAAAQGATVQSADLATLRTQHLANRAIFAIPGGSGTSQTWTNMGKYVPVIANQRYVFVTQITQHAFVDNAHVGILGGCNVTPPANPPLDTAQTDVVKTCSSPVEVDHNGILGQAWSCEIAVTIPAASVGFAGSLSVLDDPSQISTGSSTEITGSGSQSGNWVCTQGPASCVIDGADFDASGNETITVDLFAPNGDGQITWNNCASGSYDNGDGVAQPVAGNCVATQWGPQENISKTCDPIVPVAQGLMTMDCQITASGSNLTTGEYIAFVDGFAAYPTGAANVPGVMTNITSSDPWACADTNGSGNVGVCELSATDLFAAGGSSSVNMTFEFEVDPNTPSVVNCAMVDTYDTSVVAAISGQRSAQPGNPPLSTQSLPDNCVQLDVPPYIVISTPKLERAEVEKTCKAPVEAIHDGVAGYFWDCDIAITVVPTPFNGTFTLDEDASNISGSTAEFTAASGNNCSGIGSDHLTCVLDGNTMTAPEVIAVQLFTPNPTGKEPIEWENCASGVAETVVDRITTEKSCETTVIKPTDTPPPPKEIFLKKSCGKPTATEHDGEQGVAWPCEITVVAIPSPFGGSFTFTENATSVSGSGNANIIGMNGSPAWSCVPTFPTQQTDCTISGADFDPSGVETISFDLFAATNGKPIDWKNCVSGVFEYEGKERHVKGNCEGMTWTPVIKEQPEFSLEKTCVNAGMYNAMNRFICEITVTQTNNVAFGGALTVDDVFTNTNGTNSSQYIAAMQGVATPVFATGAGWSCHLPSTPSCDISASDFQSASNHRIQAALLFPAGVLDEQDFDNCAALSLNGVEVARDCISLDESTGKPTPKKPALDVVKTCEPATRSTAGFWEVDCAITVTGQNLPSGEYVRVLDELMSAGQNNAQSGALSTGGGYSTQCGGGVIAGGFGSGCNILTDDIINNNGTVTFDFHGTIAGPGGMLMGGQGVQNCAFADIASIGLHGPAGPTGTEKSCVNIPLNLSAIGNPNIFDPVIPDPTNPIGPVITHGTGQVIDLPNIGTPVGPVVTEQCEMDTLFVLDRSGSMGGGRIAQLRTAVNAAMGEFAGNGSAASMVSFAWSANADVNPAQVIPSAGLVAAVNALNASGSTNWHGAFQAAAGVVAAATKKPMVIFITDGNPNVMYNAATSSYPAASVQASLVATQPFVDAIRAQGSQILAIGLGNNVSASNFQTLFGGSIQNSYTPGDAINPFALDGMLQVGYGDVEAALTTIAAAYCPSTTPGSHLENVQKALETQGDKNPVEQLQITKESLGFCRADRGTQLYECSFRISVTNKGQTEFQGPVTVTDQLGQPRATRVATHARDGWACSKPLGGEASCYIANLVLQPGQMSSVDVKVHLAGQRAGGAYENCAILGVPEGRAARVGLLQGIMNQRGLKAGVVDGAPGNKTYAALARLQEQLELPRSRDFDGAVFDRLGLPQVGNVARDCAVADLPPMPAPPVQCNAATTVPNGEGCACRYDNMFPRNATSCSCARGYDLISGEGCVKKQTPKPKPTPEPEATLRCDKRSTYLRGDQCVCIDHKRATKTSATTCGCKAGVPMINGLCIPIEIKPRDGAEGSDGCRIKIGNVCVK